MLSILIKRSGFFMDSDPHRSTEVKKLNINIRAILTIVALLRR